MDRGGTFTDLVQVDDDGTVTARKLPSDAAAVSELCPAGSELTFGTTVATNALLERTGVRTLLVVTQGFADLVRIGDMTRPDLFDPDQDWPSGLESEVVEIAGRIDANGGEVRALGDLGALPRGGFDAVAVVLVNSHRNPAHERSVASWFRDNGPAGVHVIAGHDVSPEVGYLARIHTTLVDAAITPVLRASMRHDGIGDRALAMKSDGSTTPATSFRAPDAVLSGPAGGVLAVARIAKDLGFKVAAGLDMGGTSTDVCCVETGARDPLPRRTGDVQVAGIRLRRPTLEVHTIAAGGGSILAFNGHQLAIGPRSAGADPGPQCYGRGGPPTLTDAALLEGLVDPLAFEPPLRPELVAIPGADEGVTAADYLEVARETMAAAVQRIALARGLDLRGQGLVAFGGAAGQHAAAVADRLGVSTVVVHPLAGVLSAWGQGLAATEQVAAEAVLKPLVSLEKVREVAKRLGRSLEPGGGIRVTLDLGHQGTDNPLAVTILDGDTTDDVIERFHRTHRRRFGFDRPDQAIEVLNVRVRTGVEPPPVPTPDLGDLALPAVGPVTLFLPTTSIHVPRGWRACARLGLICLERMARQPAPPQTVRTPAGVTLWSNRLMAVAEQGGAVLQRLARSVNIKDRRDFSCAVFDEGGQLVANAPHIPVHLGAMGDTVRDLIGSSLPLSDGSAWLTNDPGHGGSHLPDLTVVTAVIHQGVRFFVASRGHHVDVGGLTPGSMPPHSTRLDEEGVVFRRVALTDAHTGDGLADLRSIAAGSRQPDTVAADLRAQIAANHHMALGLKKLGPPDRIASWMAHLLDVGEAWTREVVASLAPGKASDILYGVPLCVSLTPRGGDLTVSFAGTGGPHPGNLNAPRAVVRAAVLYALRVLIRRPLPLNDGVLRAVTLHVPAPSILAPGSNAAVAGGNVETSQRVVDLVLRAAGFMAASQGTMNNLTLGGEGWSLYETVGGGQGASRRTPGISGRQMHMTNTCATDVEVLEARLPLRVWRFALRPESGGGGKHPGGLGLIRELEVLEPAAASLLCTRRQGSGAPGLDGGQPGACGVDHLFTNGAWRVWDGKTKTLAPGDRVRVSTPGGGGWGSAVD